MDSQIAKIVAQLTAEFKAMPDVCALLFFGSSQRGQRHPHSDVDLYVLTTSSQEWHEGRLIDDVPIELTFAPLRCMRDRIRGKNPTITHAFATGTVLMQRDSDIHAVVEEAQKCWDAGPSAVSPAELLRWRFRLTDVLSDVLDLPADSLEARSIASQLVPLAVDASCAAHRCWPVTRKHLLENLRRVLPMLGPLVEAYYSSNRVEDAVSIGTHVLDELGGPAVEYLTEPREC
jgi:hypothetical protein